MMFRYTWNRTNPRVSALGSRAS